MHAQEHSSSTSIVQLSSSEGVCDIKLADQPETAAGTGNLYLPDTRAAHALRFGGACLAPQRKTMHPDDSSALRLSSALLQVDLSRLQLTQACCNTISTFTLRVWSRNAEKFWAQQVCFNSGKHCHRSTGKYSAPLA